MQLPYSAFLFDLNGTMVNDMAYHCDAWFAMVQSLGSTITKEQMEHEMYGKNEEVLNRIFGKGHFSMEQMHQIGMQKEVLYQQAYLQHLQLIKGLPQLLAAANKRGIQMAIGSAAIPFNIDFVLDNLQLRHYFSTIVSANEVIESKPNPEVFLKCANQLGVAPKDCIVFEDAPKGVESAWNAGMNCIVLTTMHAKESFSTYSNVLAFVDDYTDPNLAEILGFVAE
jgi:beta-phosphoglucomutase